MDRSTEKVCSLQQLFNRIVASKTTGDKLPKFALLAGAGCSISSCVVSGKRMIDILQKYNYLLHFDDSGQLSRWDHETETLETFISKIEHLIDQEALEQYILIKNAEHRRQFEEFASKASQLNTLPNSIKKRHNDIFQKSNGKWSEIPKDSVDELWAEYSDFLLNELTYGFWMYQYSPVSDNIQALIEELIEYRNPSVEYYLFADLVAKGMFYNIFTTNFDDFFQEALSFLGMRARICAFGDKAEVIDFTRKKPNIIKLHGDYLYNNTKNYSSETSQLHESLKSKFQEALMKFGMIVVGYAGNDYSIMSVLEEIKEQSNYPLYWCVLESDLRNKKIPWRVQELILNTNDSYFVPIRDFGQLTEFLWHKWHQAEEISQHQADSFINRAFEKAAKLNEQLGLTPPTQNSEKPLRGGISYHNFSKSENPPVASPFRTVSNESVDVQMNSHVLLQNAVSYYKSFDIDKQTLAKQITKLIGDFVFLTSYHITALINEGREIVQQKKVITLLKQLTEINILAQYKFSIPNTTSNFYVFSLAYNGDKLYRQLFRTKPAWNSTLELTNAINIKRYLATSQVISSIKQVAKIKFQIAPKLGNAQDGVRPSAVFRHMRDNFEYTYLLEVVRKKESWESILLEKLGRYNSYLSRLQGTNVYLILCAEDQIHVESTFQVYEAWRKNAHEKMISNQLKPHKVWFSHDIAFLSEKLINTLSLLYRDKQGVLLSLPVDLTSYFVDSTAFNIGMIHETEECAIDVSSHGKVIESTQSCKLDGEESSDKMDIAILPSATNSRAKSEQAVTMGVAKESQNNFSEIDLSIGDLVPISVEEHGKLCSLEETHYEYTTNDSKNKMIKDKIIETCLSFGDPGKPIMIVKFAPALRSNGLDYRELGYSKLIQLLQSQTDYISIEGTGTDKFLRLLDGFAPIKEYSKPERQTVDSIHQSFNSIKKRQTSSEISVLFHNIYLGNISLLLKSLGTMVGCYVSLDTLAYSYKDAADSGMLRYETGSMTFYTGYQHPAKGRVYMCCINNDRSQPWKFDRLFYEITRLSTKY